MYIKMIAPETSSSPLTEPATMEMESCRVVELRMELSPLHVTGMRTAIVNGDGKMVILVIEGLKWSMEAEKKISTHLRSILDIVIINGSVHQESPHAASSTTTE